MSPHLCISNGQLKLVGPHDAKITVDEFLACQENLQPNRIPVVLTPVVLIPGHEQPYWPLPETDDAIVSDDDQQLFLFYALSARGKVLVLYDGRDLETPPARQVAGGEGGSLLPAAAPPDDRQAVRRCPRRKIRHVPT